MDGANAGIAGANLSPQNKRWSHAAVIDLWEFTSHPLIFTNVRKVTRKE